MYLEKYLHERIFSKKDGCQFLIGNVSLVNSVNQEYLCECQFLIGNVSHVKGGYNYGIHSKCQFLIGNVSHERRGI